MQYLSRSEEDSAESKTEVIVVHADGFKESLAEHSGIETRNFRRQVLLVRRVKVTEGHTARETAFHHFQSRYNS